jgi:hypothetical protein
LASFCMDYELRTVSNFFKGSEDEKEREGE